MDIIDCDKYCLEYEIRNYEVDVFGNLKLATLLQFFQDMADKHAASYDFGYDFCQKHNIAWILTNYHIKINRMPMWGETIKMFSWPSAVRKVGMRRDFLVECGNEVLIQAASQWVVLNMTTHKLAALSDYVPAVQCIEEVVIDTRFPKISKPENLIKQKTFPVLLSDMDVNQHVNNAQYITWACNCFDYNWLKEHCYKEIEIQFKEETFFNDEVTISSATEDMTSIQVAHTQDGHEAVSMRILFEKK